MSLNDDSYERQPGRTAGVCVPCMKGNSVYLGGDIRARRLERSIGDSQGQGYEYPVV